MTRMGHLVERDWRKFHGITIIIGGKSFTLSFRIGQVVDSHYIQANKLIVEMIRRRTTMTEKWNYRKGDAKSSNNNQFFR